MNRQNQETRAIEERIAQLERERRELKAQLARMKRLPKDWNPEEDVSERKDPKTGRIWAQPARSMVIETLGELGSPAYTRELSLLIDALYGRPIPSTRFGTLAADEMAAFRKRGGNGRDVWIG